jgi:hypothetical protein
MVPQKQTKPVRDFKRSVHCTLRTVSTAVTKPRDGCIMQLQTDIYWSQVWGNAHKVILSDGARSAWYMVIHCIIPTSVLWHRNRLTDTENCMECGRQDAVLHRITECGVR